MEMKKHILDEQWEAFHKNKLEKEETIQFFTHITECDYCAGKLMDEMQEMGTLSAPNGLEEEVFRRGNIRKQKYGKKKQENKEFILYSLRVGFSVALSILLLLVISSKQVDVVEKAKEWKPNGKQESYTDSLVKGLRDFSVKMSDGLNTVVDRKENSKVKMEGYEDEEK